MGDKVRYKNVLGWEAGFVTQLEPLLVTSDLSDPAAEGKPKTTKWADGGWGEVAPYEEPAWSTDAKWRTWGEGAPCHSAIPKCCALLSEKLTARSDDSFAVLGQGSATTPPSARPSPPRTRRC